jgi:mannose-6-phosphate isomerase-like protein (cupin superfamily)
MSTYGLTLEQVQQINTPQSTLAPWGSVASLTAMPQFSMYRIDILPRAAQPLQVLAAGPFQVFVEAGDVVLRSLDKAGLPEVFSIPALLPHGFASFSGATVYLFGPHTADGLQPIHVESQVAALGAAKALDPASLPQLGKPTWDVREKYWGRIETILGGDVAAKRIFVRKGGQSSLEYHVQKSESYYIHSGLLKVGLRIGRAENRSIQMMAGQSYDVSPGVMHMRMGLEDTVILEVSTRDSDSDSYLVEDGQTYRHIDFDSKPQ